MGDGAEVVISHEMGHALGLPHVEDAGNLMEESGNLGCRPWLSEAQVDSMSLLPDAGSHSGELSRALAASRPLLRQLLRRRASATSARIPSD